MLGATSQERGAWQAGEVEPLERVALAFGGSAQELPAVSTRGWLRVWGRVRESPPGGGWLQAPGLWSPGFSEVRLAMGQGPGRESYTLRLAGKQECSGTMTVIGLSPWILDGGPFDDCSLLIEPCLVGSLARSCEHRLSVLPTL